MTDEAVAELVEEEEDELLDDLDEVYAAAADEVDDDFELDEDDPDLLAGLEAAALLADDVDVETAAAVGVQFDDDEEDKEVAAAALEAALAEKLSGDAAMDESELAEIAAGVPEEGLDEVGGTKGRLRAQLGLVDSPQPGVCVTTYVGARE